MGKTGFLQKLTSFEAIRNYVENNKECFVVVEEDELKKLQECYLSILKDIDNFFTEKSIKYCISGGSILGKIRHNGFIPWDDDIDITIPREDYEKLKKIYQTEDNWFCRKYQFVAPGLGKEADNRIAKLYKNDSVMESIMSSKYAINKVFVDMFVIDYVPNNKIIMRIRGSLSIVLIGIISCVEAKRNEDDCFDLGLRWKIWMFFKRVMGAIFSFIPAYKWYGYLDKITMNTKKNTPSRKITFPTGRIFYFKEMMATEAYMPFKETEFCGVHTWMPNKPEEYLNNRYGDWKTIPDHKDRETHYYKRLELGEY